MSVSVLPEIMMTRSEAQRHLEQIKSGLSEIDALLLQLDDRRGWEALGYKSMHLMIQEELASYLDKSVSQVYRLISVAKIRRELSQICENAKNIPSYKLDPLGKLPPQQWLNAWEEITSTAPDGKITKEHVQSVVNQKKSNFEPIPLSGGYQAGNVLKIQCGRNATAEQLEYNGCWGIVKEVLNDNLILAVGGKKVAYHPKNLKSLGHLEPAVMDICDYITRLWELPNLAPSVEFLLKEFFQRKLTFEQDDLVVLKALEGLY